jgi:penicillin-binding protein 1B
MSAFQVAQMYNTIATGGYHTPLRAIRDVTTRQGKPLNRYPLTLKQTIDAAPDYLTIWMMERVARYGTGASMYDVLPQNLNMAGKTGTTNKLRDSWFAGFSANREAVVWVGRDDNKSAHLTGAAGALQLWTQIMAHIDNRSLDNDPPPQIKTIPLRMDFNPAAPDHGRQQAADLYQYGQSCGNATPVPFIRGAVPPGLSACDSDIMGANAAQKQQQHKTHWWQWLIP